MGGFSHITYAHTHRITAIDYGLVSVEKPGTFTLGQVFSNGACQSLGVSLGLPQKKSEGTILCSPFSPLETKHLSFYQFYISIFQILEWFSNGYTSYNILV